MAETREAAEKPKPRMKVAVWLTLGLVGLIALIGLVVELGNLSTGSSRRDAEAKYSEIKPGMNRTEVRRLVQGLGTVMFTGIGPVELMHIGDARFQIAIYYQPDPKHPSPKIDPNGVPRDNWVVREKLLLELGRTGEVDRTLTGLGLKPRPSIKRTMFSPE